jgi:hypothetical protein
MISSIADVCSQFRPTRSVLVTHPKHRNSQAEPATIFIIMEHEGLHGGKKLLNENAK